jgi:hypothetical protein
VGFYPYVRRSITALLKMLPAFLLAGRLVVCRVKVADPALERNPYSGRNALVPERPMLDQWQRLKGLARVVKLPIPQGLMGLRSPVGLSGQRFAKVGTQD